MRSLTAKKEHVTEKAQLQGLQTKKYLQELERISRLTSDQAKTIIINSKRRCAEAQRQQCMSKEAVETKLRRY